MRIIKAIWHFLQAAAMVAVTMTIFIAIPFIVTFLLIGCAILLIADALGDNDDDQS